MADKAATSDNPISFTDTNAETGATGRGSGATSSAMQELIGGLKKKHHEQSERLTKSSRGGGKKKKNKKKKGKKKKDKYKKVRGTDKYEPQNYLLRIEGVLCCASLVMIVLWLVLTLALLILIICITRGDPKDLMFAKKIVHNGTATATP